VPHPRSPPRSSARGKPKWGVDWSELSSFLGEGCWLALAGDPLQCMARADLLLCGLPSFHSDVRIGLEERNRTGWELNFCRPHGLGWDSMWDAWLDTWYIPWWLSYSRRSGW
jgi:hypothetical protein